MVFPGHFSTGCLRCRKRKVKCDEGKPSCKKCERYGKECPGYTDQFHFRYAGTSKFAPPATPNSHTHSKRKSISTSSRRLSVVSSSASSDNKMHDDKSSYQAVNGSPPNALAIQPLHPSYDQVSLCYFISRFVSPSGSDSFPGHLTFLPGLYDHHSNGLLETATLSVASMASYNHFGGEKFRVQAYKEHGRTIRMIQETLQSEDQATDDKVIAAVLLLCIFKDISGERPDQDNEHAAGLFYLLGKRGLEQLVTSAGTEMLLLALLRLQISSFMRDDDMYTDPEGIIALLAPFNPLFGALSIMSQTLTLRVQLLSCSAAQSAAQLSGSFSEEDPVHDQRRQTLRGCFEKIGEFDEWDREAASYWQCNFEGRGPPTALGQISASTSFYDAESACIIILLRTARLTLLVSMLQYHDRTVQAEHDGKTQMLGDRTAWEECVAVLRQDVTKTIDDILALIPYAFGDIDPNGLPTVMPHDGAAAMIILHSIRLLTYCAYATPEQVQSARKILIRMNGDIGIRSAVDVKDADCLTTRVGLRRDSGVYEKNSIDLSPQSIPDAIGCDTGQGAFSTFHF